MCDEIVATSPQSELSSNGISPEMTSGLSKRGMKKLIKKQRWLERKPLKRAEEREKMKKRRAEAKLNNITLGPSRKKLKKAKMATSSCKVNVVIDFSFNDLMSLKGLNSAVKQVCFCYGVNRRVQNPVQFYVTSFNGAAKEEMKKNEGYTNWDVHFHDENFIDLFEKDKIIYLTSDSDNVVDKLEDGKAYIIGGIVDHNSQKGLCLQKATDLGLDHARLPIGEYINMKTRKVLTINHVFEILVNVCNGKSWKESLLKAIPERKGALDRSSESQDSWDNEEAENIDDGTLPEPNFEGS